MCSEALLKYGVGTSIRRIDSTLANAFGDRQFGAGRRGGAALEVAELRAASRLRPQDAIVSLDIKNAFGAVEWADALEAVLRRAPALAPMLAVQWSSLQIRIWLQDADGRCWHVMVVFGSLLQGGLDGRPVFCVVIAVVLIEIGRDERITVIWQSLLVWA